MELDNARSLSHRNSIGSARERRNSQFRLRTQKEEARVNRRLKDFESSQNLHYERANSARSERINSLTQRNMDWREKCESQMSARESAFEENFKKDIQRREHLENVLKSKSRSIRSAQKSVRERFDES